ncbi:hypothetical protein PVAG01_01963 [Phlyctema vagabunda]|uniref:Uncharacterized protein n=1 Tax=Phlyctema vagabunda TaxID=108571 RepID=A0ABR4PYU9_9HELO
MRSMQLLQLVAWMLVTLFSMQSYAQAEMFDERGVEPTLPSSKPTIPVTDLEYIKNTILYSAIVFGTVRSTCLLAVPDRINWTCREIATISTTSTIVVRVYRRNNPTAFDQLLRFIGLLGEKLDEETSTEKDEL